MGSIRDNMKAARKLANALDRRGNTYLAAQLRSILGAIEGELHRKWKRIGENRWMSP